jgi:hypothetical protein
VADEGIDCDLRRVVNYTYAEPEASLALVRDEAAIAAVPRHLHQRRPNERRNRTTEVRCSVDGQATAAAAMPSGTSDIASQLNALGVQSR